MKKLLLTGATLAALASAALAQSNFRWFFLNNGPSNCGLAVDQAGNHYTGTFSVEGGEFNGTPDPALFNAINALGNAPLSQGGGGVAAYALMLADGFKREATLVGHGELDELERRFVQDAKLLELAGAHPGVAGDAGLVLEPLLLALAGGPLSPRLRRTGDHAGADLRGGLAGAFAGDLAELHRGDFDVQVNAVEQRAGDAAQVVLDFARAAAGFAGRFAVGRPVHCRHEPELGGKGHGASGTGDGDLAFFGFLDAPFTLALDLALLPWDLPYWVFHKRSPDAGL